MDFAVIYSNRFAAIGGLSTVLPVLAAVFSALVIWRSRKMRVVQSTPAAEFGLALPILSCAPGTYEHFDKAKKH
jgi:hypothetical protein